MIYDTTIAEKLQVYFLHKYTEGMFFQSILFFLKKEEEGGNILSHGNAIDSIPDSRGQFLLAMAIRIDAAGDSRECRRIDFHMAFFKRRATADADHGFAVFILNAVFDDIHDKHLSILIAVLIIARRTSNHKEICNRF